MHTPNLPEVKFNKSGYEIRAEILDIAKQFVTEEFHSRYMGWEVSAKRDDKGNIITTVGMPEFPGLDKIMQTAQTMYDFVSKESRNKS